MAKKKITQIVEEMLLSFFQEKGYELYNSEFLKEGRDWYLRIYIDKLVDGEYVPVSTDDCELVSRYLSEKLDEEDPIEQNYFLEVSSPGLERTLLHDKDYARFAGQAAEIHLYKGIDGRKVIPGILRGLEDGNIILEDETGNRVEIAKDKAAKTKLVVII